MEAVSPNEFSQIQDAFNTEDSEVIKVLFLIDTLRCGGAERVLVNLVNNMDLKKYDVTVETLFDGGVNQERLSPNVKYFCRNAPYPKGISYIFCLFRERWLYKYFIRDNSYDVMIAYLQGASVKVISGCDKKAVKKIAWLHSENLNKGSYFSFWVSKKRAIAAYESCDSIACVSKTVAKSFLNFTGIKENLRVVYNTNETERIRDLSKKETGVIYRKGFTICSVGKLREAKGFSRLIQVIIRLHSTGYPIQLAIIGGGALLDKLQNEIAQYNANQFITMVGEKKNPYPFVAASDLFVCSSFYEGLSTAVTEAIILGKPVVSTDVSGAKEILGENNEYGLVVENSEEGIYSGIKRFLDEPALLTHYAEMAKIRADFFSTERTVKQAEDLIDDVLKN